MTFREIWRSGFVTRYHARPEVHAETLAEHHARVAQILCELHFPRLPSAELLFAALHHDVAELIVGDLPYPFKAAQPEMAEAHAEEEGRQLNRILRRGFGLGSRDMAELKLADRIAAYLYAMPQDRDNPEWAEERTEIAEVAQALGLAGQVSRMVSAVRPTLTEGPECWRPCDCASDAIRCTCPPRRQSGPESGIGQA